MGLSGPSTVARGLSHAEYPLFEKLTFTRDDVKIMIERDKQCDCLLSMRILRKRLIGILIKRMDLGLLICYSIKCQIK